MKYRVFSSCSENNTWKQHTVLPHSLETGTGQQQQPVCLAPKLAVLQKFGLISCYTQQEHPIIFSFYVELKKGTSYSDSPINKAKFLLGYGHLIPQSILPTTKLPSNSNFSRICCLTPFIPVYYSCISCYREKLVENSNVLTWTQPAERDTMGMPQITVCATPPLHKHPYYVKALKLSQTSGRGCDTH